MVAGFATRFHTAGFLFLKEVYEFGYYCLLHAKLLLTGMRQ